MLKVLVFQAPVSKNTGESMDLQLSSPIKTTLSITNTCNLDCVYCYSKCTRQPDRREMTTDEWKKLIDELIDAGVIQLFIEGGEPLYRPDILEILRYCRRRVMTWVRTNGTLITADLAEALKETGVSTMLIDLHGAKAETHDRIVGHAGSHERALEGARHVVTAGMPLLMLLVLNRHNYRELQEYVELARDIGALRVGILRLYPLGRARERWDDLALSLDEMMGAIEAIEVPEGLGLMQSWHPNDGNCCYQLSAVNAFGDSIGCPYLRDFVNHGNVRDMPFMETWEQPLWQRLRAGNVKDGCTTCHSTRGTEGGCRSTAFAFTGDWEAPDPFCVTMNNGIDLRVLPENPAHNEADKEA